MSDNLPIGNPKVHQPYVSSTDERKVEKEPNSDLPNEITEISNEALKENALLTTHRSVIDNKVTHKKLDDTNEDTSLQETVESTNKLGNAIVFSANGNSDEEDFEEYSDSSEDQEQELPSDDIEMSEEEIEALLASREELRNEDSKHAKDQSNLAHDKSNLAAKKSNLANEDSNLVENESNLANVAEEVAAVIEDTAEAKVETVDTKIASSDEMAAQIKSIVEIFSEPKKLIKYFYELRDDVFDAIPEMEVQAKQEQTVKDFASKAPKRIIGIYNPETNGIILSEAAKQAIKNFKNIQVRQNGGNVVSIPKNNVLVISRSVAKGVAVELRKFIELHFQLNLSPVIEEEEPETKEHHVETHATMQLQPAEGTTRKAQASESSKYAGIEPDSLEGLNGLSTYQINQRRLERLERELSIKEEKLKRQLKKEEIDKENIKYDERKAAIRKESINLHETRKDIIERARDYSHTLQRLASLPDSKIPQPLRLLLKEIQVDFATFNAIVQKNPNKEAPLSPLEKKTLGHMKEIFETVSTMVTTPSKKRGPGDTGLRPGPIAA